MKLILLVCFLLKIVNGDNGATNCDQLGVLLYEDMSCKPSYGKNTSCPEKYDCLGLKKSNNNCYLRGKAYKIYEQVDSKITAPSCNLGCFCEKEDDTARFKCAILDCPEWLGQHPKPECYRKYSLESCCAVREICPPYENSTKCIYNGREYKEGENFLSENSCWRCICQPGFNGKVEEPFCRRTVCGVQTKSQEKLQSRCAPLYYRRPYRDSDPLCCPYNWICSEGNEKINGHPRSENNGQSTEN